MVMLKNPELPATSKQLWLLHILTKTDTRNLNITMAECSKRIEAAKNKPINKTVKPTENKPIEHKPLIEREVIQGIKPSNQTDMQKIQADFDLNARPLAIKKLITSNQSIENVNIGFYDFNCKDCLFGQTGICEPNWNESSFTTSGNKVITVNFDCRHFEPTAYRPNCNCKRPKGKQCHRKSIENKCLNCAFRSNGYSVSHNRSEWYSYIPTMQERLDNYNKDLQTRLNPGDCFKDIDFTDSIKVYQNIIRLLNKLNS